MYNDQNNNDVNNMNNVPNNTPTVEPNTINTNGMQNTVQDDYYNNNSYYSNSNYENNYSDTSYEEKEKKNGVWWKILLAILIILIIILLLLRFCVGDNSTSADEKYTILKDKICAAAETYIMNNPNVLDRTAPGKVAVIKYQKLSDANLIEAQIANPYYKGGLFSKNTEDKYYSLDNSVRLTVGADLTLGCELVDNSNDVTAPVIRLNGDAEVTYAIGTEFQDPMATATDDYDGDLTDKIVRSGNVDLTKAGTYELTYTVADSAGNTSSVKRVIKYEEYPDLEVTLGSILDGVTPMISLKGSNPYCMVKGTKYVEPGATATDNVDGNITNKIAVTNKISGNLIGSFRVTYKVEDSSGNQAVAYRAVIVSTECPDQNGEGNSANTAPKITLIGKNSVTINVGTEYIDLGATAYDKEDGDITSRMTTDDTQVNVNKAGTYKVLYRVTDSGGLTSNAERTVTVKAAVSGNPSVRFTESKENINILVGKGTDTLLTAPKAVNENGASVYVSRYIEDYYTKVSVGAINWNKEGKYRVVYTATHANGQVSQSKSIIVTIYGDPVTIGGKDAINVNVRTDNCNITEADLIAGGVTFTTSSSSTPIIKITNNEDKACKVATYEVTVTATSPSGEEATKKITVYVVNGTSEPINTDAPSKVAITKNTSNLADPYNASGNWVGGAVTGVLLEFTATPATGTTIARYQWSRDCSTIDGELRTTSSTTGSFTWDGEGKNSICIRAVSTDEIAGPWSNPSNIYIDKTGPEVEFTHTWADGKDDWHNTSSLTVSYKGVDLASGIDHFEYTYDDVNAKKAEEIVSIVERSGNLIVNENNEPTRPELFVFVRGVDKAGNKGGWVANPAYTNMDTIKPNAPTTSVADNGGVAPKITATGEDVVNTITNRQSGIEKFKFEVIDSLNNLVPYYENATIDKDNILKGTATFTMPANTGTENKTYTVRVWSVDKAGNNSESYKEESVTVKPGTPATGVDLKNGKKVITNGGACNTKALNPGGIITLTATPIPANSVEKKVSWSIDTTTVAKVDENGKVTAVAVGTATLTAKIGNVSTTCKITVTTAPQSSSGGGSSSGNTTPTPTTKTCYCTRDKTGEVTEVTVPSSQACDSSVCPAAGGSSGTDFYFPDDEKPCVQSNCNSCDSGNAYTCTKCASGYHPSGSSCVKDTPVVTTPNPSTGNSQIQNPNWCFLSGTKVLTINGYKDIDKIIVGDKVLSYNVNTKKNEYSTVLKTFIHDDSTTDLYSLTINGKIVKSTGTHPFYVQNGDRYNWVDAENLKVGDKVMNSNGKYYPITSISSEKVTNDFYNIEVENNHNYYVTEDNILVHNKG